MVFKVFGPVVSIEGYEIDFKIGEDTVSAVIYPKADFTEFNLEIFNYKALI